MIQFILSPIDIGESSVTFQLLADSPVRKRGFVANCVMTKEEFVAFRKTLLKGVQKINDRSLVIHPDLKTLEVKWPRPESKKSKKKKK